MLSKVTHAMNPPRALLLRFLVTVLVSATMLFESVIDQTIVAPLEKVAHMMDNLSVRATPTPGMIIIIIILLSLQAELLRF